MDKLLYSIEEGCERLSIGRSLMYEMIASGRIRSVKVGRRRLIPAPALDEFAEDLDDATTPQPAA